MLPQSLRNTRQAIVGHLARLVGASELDDETWEDIEAQLIQADLGVATAQRIATGLEQAVRKQGILTRDGLRAELRAQLMALLPPAAPDRLDQPRNLTVLLIVGVNGSGKTTTCAKLAELYAGRGRRPLLVAADTFRAAAVEQLKTWGERTGVPVIAGQTGGDPGAVAYDGIRAAKARDRDLLIVDTAGRLHTKHNLMEELQKVHRVLERNVHEAPHETWIVLDGNTGQNAIQQAKSFRQAVGVTGTVVTKLDGSARGGVVFSIAADLALPVRYIGVGEGSSDLLAFNPADFVDQLLVDL